MFGRKPKEKKEEQPKPAPPDILYDVDTFREQLLVVLCVIALIVGSCLYANMFAFTSLDRTLIKTVADYNGTVQNITEFKTYLNDGVYDVQIAMFILGSTMFLPVGLISGFFFFNKEFFIRMMRKLKKKNFGFVYLVGTGRNTITFIKDLNRDNIRKKDGIWILERDRIYKELDGKPAEEYPINPKDILTRGGIPCVFLDINTMRPLTFKDETTGELQQKPELVNAVLMKEIAVEKAKALMLKRTFEILLVIAVGLIVVGLLLNWYIYSSLDTMAKTGVKCIMNISDVAGSANQYVFTPNGTVGVITPR